MSKFRHGPYADHYLSQRNEDDNPNKPINRGTRSPEYWSTYHCPSCMWRMVYLAEDRLHYCRNCQQEYDGSEPELTEYTSAR